MFLDRCTGQVRRRSQALLYVALQPTAPPPATGLPKHSNTNRKATKALPQNPSSSTAAAASPATRAPCPLWGSRCRPRRSPPAPPLCGRRGWRESRPGALKRWHPPPLPAACRLRERRGPTCGWLAGGSQAIGSDGITALPDFIDMHAHGTARPACAAHIEVRPGGVIASISGFRAPRHCLTHAHCHRTAPLLIANT